jgi:hypothetical protein
MNVAWRLSVLAVLSTACATARPAPAAATPPPRVASPTVASAPAPSAAPPDSSSSGTPASALVDHLGDSTTTAVDVPADAPEEGVPFERNWIFDRYGRFRKISSGTGTLEGRRYDVIRVELGDHSERTIYFDITENWKRWSPQPPH